MKALVAISRITIVAAVIIILLLLLLVLGISYVPRRGELPAEKGETEIDVIFENDPASSGTTSSKQAGVNPDTSCDSRDSPGSYPPIQANYQTHVGFRAYSKRMTALGARFFVVGNGKPGIVEIDLDSGDLRKVNTATLTNGFYSPRTRIIGNDPAVGRYARKARQELSIGNPEVVMLLPGNVEKEIYRNLRDSLKSHGLQLNRINGFFGMYYLTPDSRLILRITRAVDQRGNIVTLRHQIYL